VGRPLRTFIATPQSATVITLDINHLDVNDVWLDLKLRNRRVRVCPRFVRIAQNGRVAKPGADVARNRPSDQKAMIPYRNPVPSR
jgi:hypothetical protein